VNLLASSTTVELARAQFATTSIYHFLFVPLTLGMTVRPWCDLWVSASS